MELRDSPADTTKVIDQELAQRRGWLLTIAVGFALHILSIVIGLKPVGPMCGSPLVPNSRAAEISDSQLHTTGMAAQCYRTIESAAVPVWILMAAGIALVLSGVAVRIVGIRRSVDRTRTAA